jgi:hypothetical protein
LNLVEVDVDEHMPMPVDLGAARREQTGAKRQRKKRGQRCPDGGRLELTQIWNAPRCMQRTAFCPK